MPSGCHMPLQQVCCCGPGGQGILIDGSGCMAPQQHGMQQPNIGSATL